MSACFIGRVYGLSLASCSPGRSSLRQWTTCSCCLILLSSPLLNSYVFRLKLLYRHGIPDNGTRHALCSNEQRLLRSRWAIFEFCAAPTGSHHPPAPTLR